MRAQSQSSYPRLSSRQSRARVGAGEPPDTLRAPSCYGKAIADTFMRGLSRGRDLRRPRAKLSSDGAYAIHIRLPMTYFDPTDRVAYELRTALEEVLHDSHKSGL